MKYMPPELVELTAPSTFGVCGGGSGPWPGESSGCTNGNKNNYLCNTGTSARGGGCAAGDGARNTCSVGLNVGYGCDRGNRNLDYCVTGSTLSCEKGAAGSVSCGPGANPVG